VPLQSRTLRGPLGPTGEPRIQQPLPSKRSANRAGRRAEQASELVTKRRVVAVAKIHRELQQRRRLRALQTERGVDGARGLEPTARRRQRELVTSRARGSRGLTDIVEQRIHRGSRRAVKEDFSDQVGELRRHRRMLQREPLDDVRGQVDRLGEEPGQGLANRVAVDEHTTHVQLCGHLDEMSRLGVERATESEHERHGGVTLPNVKQAALERVEVADSLTDLEPENRAGAEIGRSNAIDVDGAAERGVGRRYDGDRQRGPVLLMLHGTAERLLVEESMRSKARHTPRPQIPRRALSVECATVDNASAGA
jgi:hypothetical protein